MKEYIKQLIDGGVCHSVEMDERGIDRVFTDDDGCVIPFEGNAKERFEESSDFLHEDYLQNSLDKDIFLQINQLTDGNYLITLNNRGAKAYQYLKASEKGSRGAHECINEEIGALMAEIESNGSSFERIGRCGTLITVYKLTDAWLLVNSEIVYGKHAYSVDIIADNIERAKEIESRLFVRMGSRPVSYRSRYERFNFNKLFDKYNGSAECNRHRLKYLKMIKEAYAKFDFSEIFKYLDEGCSWGGAKGREAVTQMLIKSATTMKQRGYVHNCTLVRVGKPVSPLECNTKPDGSGKRCFVGLLYHQGEFCMVDATENDVQFYRMDLSPDGRIFSYYATLPSGDFYPVTEE